MPPLPSIAARDRLPERAAADIGARGFTALPGVVPRDRIGFLATADDRAVASATGTDIGVGRSSSRVTDFVTGAPSSTTSTSILRCSRRLGSSSAGPSN